MFFPSTLLKSGFTPTLKDFSSFLTFLYGKRKFKVIIQVFSQFDSNEMNADTVSCKTFIKALLKQGKYDEAAVFLKTLLGKSCDSDSDRVFDSLFKEFWASSNNPEKGFSSLKDLLKTDDGLPSSPTFFYNYVCSSVISAFLRIGKPDLAIGFYENAVISGSLKPNTVTCTHVLAAYCKLTKVDRISDLVAWMKSNEVVLDVVFYSIWLRCCFDEGLIGEPFSIYRAMLEGNVGLDVISYTILIDGFSKDRIVEKAVGFLYKMRKEGIVPNLVTYTAIMLGFCEKGKLDEAFAIFNMVKASGMDVDEVTYAVLIHGVCREGNFDLSFRLLGEMNEKGIHPGVITYNTIINGLCKVGRTREADDFAKDIIGDVVTYSILLHGYIQERSFSGILKTKGSIEKAGIRMDIVMCNIMIKAFMMMGLFEDALEVFNGLPGMNLAPTSVTYCTLIDGYCKSGRIYEALEIFEEFQKTSISSGLPLNITTCRILIEATLHKHGVEGVFDVLSRTKHFGIRTLSILCNEAICLLCNIGFPEVSCDILSMNSEYVRIGRRGYYSILHRLLLKGEINRARQVLTTFVKLYGLSDLRASEIIVHYLCLSDVKRALLFLSAINDYKSRIIVPVYVFRKLMKDGRVFDAYRLLIVAENNLPSSLDVFDYSVMIDSLCKERRIDEALNLCSLMKRNGISPNTIHYNLVIHGLCCQGCLVEAFRLFDSMKMIGILPSEFTYGALIDALLREGLLLDSRLLFEKMIHKGLKPNTHIYNSLINGYCKSGLLEEGYSLFRELERRNLEPDGFTISSLINGYCVKGEMEGALNLFFEFSSKGLLPDFLGFLHVVRGLYSKGRIEESQNILREMLLSRSVVDFLSKVDSETKSDSVVNLLILLCERGDIKDAVSLLEKVESLLFSSKRNNSYKAFEKFLDLCPNEDTRTHKSKSFDSFFTLIHSLCSNGETVKANRLAKFIIRSDPLRV